MAGRQITIFDFLTEAEVQRALDLWKLWLKKPVPPPPDYPFGAMGYAAVVCEQIIQPNMERINKALGQENDPKYLAYVVEYVMMHATNEET